MTQEEKSEKLYQTLKPLLDDGSPVELHPHGSSMWPLITSSKDTVLIQPRLAESCHTGDIILYRRSSGLLVLHRLCRIKKDGYYFVGDNQTEIEGPLQAEQLLGVVTHIQRKGHTFSVKHPFYRIISRIWLIMRPIRHKISRPLGILFRKLLRQPH